MDGILRIERHDFRELARVTLTDAAASMLKRWKKGDWTEFRGHGTGRTGRAAGAAHELLDAARLGIIELETAEGWAENNRCGKRGNYHAVFLSESGDLIHATLVARTDAGDGYYLAG